MRPIAFFDVDGTLVAGTTMHEFLRFRLGTDAAERQWRELRRDGAGRAEANRRYFRLYAGTRWSDLMSEGERWYETWSRRSDGYVSGGLGALRRHRAHGHAVVLVSGSFLPCLLPIAAHLGAEAVLCTEPETGGGGVLTGTAQPMIGRAKAVAAQRLAADWHVPAGHCFAYGDHASDLDLLGAVGHPAVVGDDPDLVRLAARYGWPRLPALPVAAPGLCLSRSLRSLVAPGGRRHPASSPRSSDRIPPAPGRCYCGCAVAAWSMSTVEIHPPAGHGVPPRNARTREAS